MKIKLSNILLGIGIIITIFGVLMKILHHSIGFFTGNYIIYLGLLINGIAIALNIVFTKKP